MLLLRQTQSVFDAQHASVLLAAKFARGLQLRKQFGLQWPSASGGPPDRAFIQVILELLVIVYSSINEPPEILAGLETVGYVLVAQLKENFAVNMRDVVYSSHEKV